MIRPFSPDDIPKFPEVHVYTYGTQNKPIKEYLYIKRKSFISCVVIIDKTYGVFIEQYRPVIEQTTLEIPMGKIEQNENPENALWRELEEECNLRFSEKEKVISIVVKNPRSQEKKSISFSSYSLTKDKENFLSPGFSVAKQHPFFLELTTNSGDFIKELGDFTLFSQEEQLTVHHKNIDALFEPDGISRYMLLYYQTMIR